MSAFPTVRLLSPALEAQPRRRLALDLLTAGLHAVDPRRVTGAVLDRWAAEGVLDGPCSVLAFGKAARSMTTAAIERGRLQPGCGVAITPVADAGPLPGVDVLSAAHPVPDDATLAASAQLWARAITLPLDLPVLVLLSGGGSALFEVLRDGVSLEQLQELTRQLQAAGADIARLNGARAQLSQSKEGGLARRLAPRRSYVIVLSDVPGHEPHLVASGPMSVRGAPGPGVERFEVAADNHTAVRAIIAAGKAAGLRLAHGRALRGEARTAGAAFAQEGATACRDGGFDGMVAGGETTVTVTGSGLGGRNQEFVLGAGRALAEGRASGSASGLIAALGTDGVDGTSGAAGALLDGLLATGSAAGDRGAASAALRTNSSARFFEATGSALVTETAAGALGPTGTNVADIALYLP